MSKMNSCNVGNYEQTNALLKVLAALCCFMLTVNVAYHFVQAQQCAIKVETIDDSDMTKLRGIITGPPDTPFEGSVSCDSTLNVTFV